jgi:SAM-dependent methyltransferase
LEAASKTFPGIGSRKQKIIRRFVSAVTSKSLALANHPERANNSSSRRPVPSVPANTPRPRCRYGCWPRKLSRGWRLFDAGTGTGIFALAARRLGADEALGIDTDPRAVAHARRNARFNCIARTKFIVADVLQWNPASRYDIITANLYSELFIAALPRFQLWLRSGGWLIASGILHNQSQLVVSVLEDRCFRLEQARRRGKWVALLCQLAR